MVTQFPYRADKKEKELEKEEMEKEEGTEEPGDEKAGLYDEVGGWGGEGGERCKIEDG